RGSSPCVATCGPGPGLPSIATSPSCPRPRRPCEPPRLPQHPRDILPVPQPETVDRAEVRDRSVSCEVAKREVAPQPPRDLPPAVDSCVAAYSHRFGGRCARSGATRVAGAETAPPLPRTAASGHAPSCRRSPIAGSMHCRWDARRYLTAMAHPAPAASRCTSEEFFELVARGVLAPDDRVELPGLDGLHEARRPRVGA